MVGCCVYGCTNRSSQKTKVQLGKEKNPAEKISFYRFPQELTRRAEWIKMIRREQWAPTSSSRVCSIHFEERFLDKSLAYVRLQPDAIPTIFPTYPLHLQTQKHTRKLPAKRILETDRAVNEDGITNIVNETMPNTSFKPQANTLQQIASPPTSPPRKKKLLISRTTSVSPKSRSRPAVSSRESSLLNKMKVMKQLYRKKLKTLQQRKRRQQKRLANLGNILANLKKRYSAITDNVNILSALSKGNADLIKRQISKRNDNALSQKYTPELRTFALTLHYYSPAAYAYVRSQFDTCLPHPKTISRWYRSVDAEPGFVSEALMAIKLKAAASEHIIQCALVFDEMAIRKNVEFDGRKYYGFVNMGSGVDSDEQAVAKEALVFMIVAINAHWKVPVGYFLTQGLNSEQKSNLLRQCLVSVHETGVRVVSVTFDGLSSNFSMMNTLGCTLDGSLNMKTYFSHPISKENVYVFPDPCHMLKLVRNTLGEKGIIFDSDNNPILWKYFEELHDLQQSEGLHLANKVRGNHVNFQKQKMKVRLATQLMSRSVAVAFQICSDILQLKEFKDCQATSQFITTFNDLFDILNSRSIKQFDLKKPINQNNCDKVFATLERCQKYIYDLKCVGNGEKIIHSNRKTGFIGFLVCIQTVKELVKELVLHERNSLHYIPTYKLSQDHVELFFGCIRARGGYNNNPTARQFMAAFKRLLIHTELKDSGSGNCVPLENISILHCRSSTSSTNAVEIINSSVNSMLGEAPTSSDMDIEHSYSFSLQNLSEFSKQIIAYISGFVVRCLLKQLKCETCIAALTDSRKISAALIILRDQGGLIYPSEDVLNICFQSEKILKRALAESTGNKLLKKFSTLVLVRNVLHYYLHLPVFTSLQKHLYDHSATENHIVQLIRAIAEKYFYIRLRYIAKYAVDHTGTKRQYFNKLVQFTGD